MPRSGAENSIRTARRPGGSLETPLGRVPAGPQFFWSCFLLFLLLGAPLRSHAQALAHPGWAGSGVTLAPWWRDAVFYHLDPARFQASGSESRGSLAGLAQRLDYLQTLGVDALVLDAPDGSRDLDSEALEELIQEASRHHLRVLLTLPPALAAGPRDTLLRTVHEWLGEGAAGVFLRDLPPGVSGGAAAGDSLAALGALLRATPGDRVLLTDFQQTGRYSTVTVLPTTPDVRPNAAAALRSALVTAANVTGNAGAGLLCFGGSPATGSPDAVAYAVALLASRGAALFDFGAEIGLNTEPSAAGQATGAAPVMQWTPANVQQAPVERVAPPPPPAPGQPTPFGPYRPFVRPPPGSLTGAAPASPRVSLDRDIPPPAPDPNTLPGFTAGALPVEPVQGETVNVATEERDRGSVLNAYRALLALHHGNATLRSGTQVVLNHDTEDLLVFLRRPPPGARTTGVVIVAANFGTTPAVLSLDAELARLGLRPGPLRLLFSAGPHTLTGQSTGTLRLPAHAVFLGELLHNGHP